MRVEIDKHETVEVVVGRYMSCNRPQLTFSHMMSEEE